MSPVSIIYYIIRYYIVIDFSFEYDFDLVKCLLNSVQINFNSLSNILPLVLVLLSYQALCLNYYNKTFIEERFCH